VIATKATNQSKRTSQVEKNNWTMLSYAMWDTFFQYLNNIKVLCMIYIKKKDQIVKRKVIAKPVNWSN
jgi:hypothetical protein